jgi:hypothetical protein
MIYIYKFFFQLLRDQKKLTDRDLKELRLKYEAQYLQLAERNEISDIEEFDDNYELSFTEPKHLTEYFDKLESSNLNIISNK